jgi:hypothetical protein
MAAPLVRRDASPELLKGSQRTEAAPNPLGNRCRLLCWSRDASRPVTLVSGADSPREYMCRPEAPGWASRPTGTPPLWSALGCCVTYKAYSPNSGAPLFGLAGNRGRTALSPKNYPILMARLAICPQVRSHLPRLVLPPDRFFDQRSQIFVLHRNFTRHPPGFCIAHGFGSMRVSSALLRHWEGLSRRVRCAGHSQPFLVSSLVNSATRASVNVAHEARE